MDPNGPRRIGDYVTHPAADAFPLMIGEEFRHLVEDIKANGLLESIWRYQGKILDGRNRLRGCIEAKIRPRFREYDGDDPIGFVVSMNISRRHLNESQRAIVAAKLATMPSGRPSKAGKSAGLRTLGDAASLLNVGERTARDARAVLAHAVPELVQAVEHGDLSVTAAAELAQLDPDVQREAARNAREKSGAHLLRKARHQDGQEQGEDRPKDPKRALIRTITRALEQLGATVETSAAGIRVAYAGDVYELELVRHWTEAKVVAS